MRFIDRHSPLKLLISLVFAAAAGSELRAQMVSASNVPRRLIVMYRNGAVPGDAELRVLRAGAHLIRRHERFRAGLVSGTAASEDAMRKHPVVEYEDCVITASSLFTQRVSDENSSLKLRPRPSMPRLPFPFEVAADTYHSDSPQRILRPAQRVPRAWPPLPITETTEHR